jgi:ABC-2 type transport system permease protein
MRVVLTIALKDLRQLWRDRFGMFWVLAFPLLMALFFGAMFSGEDSAVRKLRIAWVNDSNASQAVEFREQLGKSSALDVVDLPLDSARQRVTAGKLVAFVRYEMSEPTEGGSFGLPQGRIRVGIDPSRKAEAGYLEGLLSQAYFSRLQTLFSDYNGARDWIRQGVADVDSSPGMTPEQRTQYRNSLMLFDTALASMRQLDTGSGSAAESASPFGKLDLAFEDVAVKRTGPRSSWEITFPQSIQWGMIGCVAAFALGLVVERTRGTYLRLRLAPISRIQILAGKGLACFLAGTGVCLLLMLFGILVFKVRVASFPMLLAAIFAAAICFVGIMMLVSVLGKTENSVAGAGWAIMLVMSMTGGGMMPLMFMPPWLGTVANFSPIKWSILALEGAIWRGFGWSEMLTPLAILVGVGLVGFTVGVTVLRRSEI